MGRSGARRHYLVYVYRRLLLGGHSIGDSLLLEKACASCVESTLSLPLHYFEPSVVAMLDRVLMIRVLLRGLNMLVVLGVVGILATPARRFRKDERAGAWTGKVLSSSHSVLLAHRLGRLVRVHIACALISRLTPLVGIRAESSWQEVSISPELRLLGVVRDRFSRHFLHHSLRI